MSLRALWLLFIVVGWDWKLWIQTEKLKF